MGPDRLCIGACRTDNHRVAYSYARRRVLDHGRILEFDAAVLASGTSRRPGVPRWSELVVYRVSDGSYLISRVGRSTVAHQEGCGSITWRTPRWLDATPEEQQVSRVPCLRCRPRIGPGGIDPTLFVEPDWTVVMLPQDADAIIGILLESPTGRPRSPEEVPALILDMLDQLAGCGDPALEAALAGQTSRTVPS